MKLKVKSLEWTKSTDEYYVGKPPAGIWGRRSVYRVFKDKDVWKVMEPMCEHDFPLCRTPEQALQLATRHFKKRILDVIEILD